MKTIGDLAIQHKLNDKQVNFLIRLARYERLAGVKAPEVVLTREKQLIAERYLTLSKTEHDAALPHLPEVAKILNDTPIDWEAAEVQMEVEDLVKEQLKKQYRVADLAEHVKVAALAYADHTLSSGIDCVVEYLLDANGVEWAEKTLLGKVPKS